MNNTFKREQRYLVIKVKDAKHYLDKDQLKQLADIADTIEAGRKAVGLPGLECVVIESHWPEYEATWKAIEARVTGAQAQPAPSVPDGWLRAIDETLVVTHLGVANADDSYEAAKRKLNELIGWHTDVATDPAVNGGFKLVPADAQPAPSVPTSLLVAIADLATQMGIVSRVGFIDAPNDKDSCAAFCVAEGTWLELMSCVELLADEVVALAAAPEPKS